MTPPLDTGTDPRPATRPMDDHGEFIGPPSRLEIERHPATAHRAEAAQGAAALRCVRCKATMQAGEERKCSASDFSLWCSEGAAPLADAASEMLLWIDTYDDAMGHGYCAMQSGEPGESCTCGFDEKRERWKAAIEGAAPRAEGLDPELAAIFLAAAMKECGYTATEADARSILDYLDGDDGVVLSRPAEARHYPNDNCGDPDHDTALEAWYARAEGLLDRAESLCYCGRHAVCENGLCRMHHEISANVMGNHCHTEAERRATDLTDAKARMLANILRIPGCDPAGLNAYAARQFDADFDAALDWERRPRDCRDGHDERMTMDFDGEPIRCIRCKAPAAPRAEGLDVPRFWKAENSHVLHHRRNNPAHDGSCDDWIAVEYARLSRPSDERQP